MGSRKIGIMIYYGALLAPVKVVQICRYISAYINLKKLFIDTNGASKHVKQGSGNVRPMAPLSMSVLSVAATKPFILFCQVFCRQSGWNGGCVVILR